MDVKWKDGKGNILNADRDRIIYLEFETNIKHVIRNEEVKKITIVDGLLNIFRDFENDLIMTIVIPKKNKRNAIKIFDEYDKTGNMYNRGNGNILLEIFLDAFLDLSLTLTNPISAFLTIPVILLIIFLTIRIILGNILGDFGKYAAYAMLLGYPTYKIIQYILIRIKRRRLKEI